MTDSNYTHISVLLDVSGSMAHLVKDTVAGFASFLEEQKKLPGKATLSLGTFSLKYNVLTEMADIRTVAPVTEDICRTGGGTALLEALHRSVESLGRSLNALPEEKRPGKVLFLVITDGEENSSAPTYTKKSVSDLVRQQESVYKWNFIYMGANVDAFSAAENLGIRKTNALNYHHTAKGLGDTYAVLGNTVSHVRSSNVAGASLDFYDGSENVDEVLKKVVVDSAKSKSDPKSKSRSSS